MIAYIDPGAGTMAVQALLAAAVAVPFFLRHRLAAALERLRGRKSDPASAVDASDD